MNSNFKFRSGKYSGKTYGWVEENDPLYLEWISENRPEMLKEIKAKETKKEVKVKDLKEDVLPSIRANENFDAEPPSPLSIPYMLDNIDKYEEQLSAFYKTNKHEYRLIKEKHEREKISRM